jgi:hypothetical protein
VVSGLGLIGAQYIAPLQSFGLGLIGAQYIAPLQGFGLGLIGAQYIAPLQGFGFRFLRTLELFIIRHSTFDKFYIRIIHHSSFIIHHSSFIIHHSTFDIRLHSFIPSFLHFPSPSLCLRAVSLAMS